jgi:hypothetical protein
MTVYQRSPSKKLDEKEVSEMLEKLERHFGEPVKPVGQYCAALKLWSSALRMKAERLDAQLKAMSSPHEILKDDADRAKKFAEDVSHIFLQIMKSNLLARLIYEGESLRTEMCPVHKGVWSGCFWAEKDDANCKCQWSQDGHIGSNVTGWLP